MLQLPFGFHSTASEVLRGVDLPGKTMIVTGGASGIGIETTSALAGAGARVVIAVRRPEAAEEVATDLRVKPAILPSSCVSSISQTAAPSITSSTIEKVPSTRSSTTRGSWHCRCCNALPRGGKCNSRLTSWGTSH